MAGSEEAPRPGVGRAARETTAAAEEGETSEGPIGATTPGNGVAPGPGRAKGARVETNFKGET